MSTTSAEIQMKLTSEQKETIGLIRPGLDKVNPENGSTNCFECALKGSAILTHGLTSDRAKPSAVAKNSDPLEYNTKHAEDERVVRAFTSNAIFIGACSGLTFNGDSQELTIEIDTQASTPKKITFKKIELKALVEHLREYAPRRNGDTSFRDTSNGFVLFNLKQPVRASGGGLHHGHILNYFVDKQRNVVLVDYQSKEAYLVAPNNQITKITAQTVEPKKGQSITQFPLFQKLQPNAFWHPTSVPEGYQNAFRVKAEPLPAAPMRAMKVEQCSSSSASIELNPYLRTYPHLRLPPPARQILACLRAGRKDELKTICESFSLRERFSGISIGFLIATEGDTQACTLALRFGAGPGNIAHGLAYFGDEKTLNKLLKAPSVKAEYNWVAPYAAQGGHKALALTSKDYNLVAAYAAQGGHEALTLSFFNDPGNTSKDYNWVAAYAARGGHKALALSFFNDFGNTTKNYNWVAAAAAQSGHKALALSFFNDPSNTTKNYNWVAAAAAERGHKALALSFFNDPGNTSKDYNRMAAAAAQGGHKALALSFFNDSGNTSKDYNWVADYAAQGGHKALALSFFNDFGNTTKNYNWVAAAAAERGHKALALSFFNDLGNTSKDYNRMAAAAARGGYHMFALKIPTLEASSSAQASHVARRTIPASSCPTSSSSSNVSANLKPPSKKRKTIRKPK